MKRILVLVLLMLSSAGIFAQQPGNFSFKQLRFGFEPVVDIWQKVPGGIKPKAIQRGATFQVMYHQGFGRSDFYIAAGGMLASHNFYSNGRLSVNAQGVSVFQAIADSIKYSNNKISVTYADLPLEVYYKTKGHFAAGIGFKPGFLIHDNYKYKGPDATGLKEIKTKQLNNENLLMYRLGTYAFIGYKWASVKFTYTFTGLFEEEKGPQMYPLSIGLLVRPY